MERIGFSREEILAKVAKIYPTVYERSRGITVTEVHKTIDQPTLTVWEVHKSDGTITLAYAQRLGFIDRWSPLLFLMGDQVPILEQIIKRYYEVVKR